jgi:hypothetical protein
MLEKHIAGLFRDVVDGDTAIDGIDDLVAGKNIAAMVGGNDVIYIQTLIDSACKTCLFPEPWRPILNKRPTIVFHYLPPPLAAN